MKSEVARELEAFLFRPNLGDRAHYYAIIFLNQMVFGEGDGALAQNMIRLYFQLFKVHCARAITPKEGEGATDGKKANPHAPGSGKKHNKGKGRGKAGSGAKGKQNKVTPTPSQPLITLTILISLISLISLNNNPTNNLP